MTTPPSPLRTPEIVKALQDLARECQKGEFNRRAILLLKNRFSITATKGQLYGLKYREGIVTQTEEMSTDGAAALRKAQILSYEADRKRNRMKDQREVTALSAPEFPRMLDPHAVPWNAGKRFHPKSAVVTRPAPAPPPPARPVAPVAPPVAAEVPSVAPLAPKPAPPILAPRPPPAPVVRMPRPVAPARSCCWPMGDPEPAQIMPFCDAPVHPGRPYCLKHCRIAYQGFRENRPALEAETYGGLFPGPGRMVSR